MNYYYHGAENLKPRHSTGINLGLSVLPGINISEDTRLYTRIEAQWAADLNFGLGVQHKLNKNWDVRFEVDKAWGGSSNWRMTQPVVGLVYHFD